MNKKINAFIIAMVLMLPVALGGCGGGGGGGGSVSPTPAQVTEEVITDKQWGYIKTSNGTYVNDAWNLNSTESPKKYQALIKRWGGNLPEPQYGWVYDLENVNGAFCLTAPHVAFGQRPYDNGYLGNNGHGFPKKAKDINSLKIHYSIELSGTADQNVNGSTWFLVRPTTDPQYNTWTDVKVEFMVWTKRPSWRPGTEMLGEVEIDGITWEIYKTVFPGNATQASWTCIAYVTKNNLVDVSYDFMHIARDAEVRGLVDMNHYLSGFEIASEIKTGSGKLILKDVSVEVK